MSNQVSKRVDCAFHEAIAALGNAGKPWDGEKDHCAGIQVIHE